MRRTAAQLLAAGLAAACVARGRAARAQETVRLAETWSDGTPGEWSAAGDAAWLGVRDGAMTLGFDAQTCPWPQRAVLCRKLEPGAVVTNVSLRVLARDAAPSGLRVRLRTARRGEVWGMDLPAPPAGQWTAYNLPVGYAFGWRAGPGSTAAAFFNDMLSIEGLELTVARGGATCPQELRVDDVVVLGLRAATVGDPGDDADGDNLPDTWEDRFGLNVADAADAAADADGDGLTNLAEFRAGTSPVDARSCLALRFLSGSIRGAAGFLVLEWPSAPGRTYSVRVADDLRHDPVAAASGIPATPPTNRHEVAIEPHVSKRFYIVNLDRQ